MLKTFSQMIVFFMLGCFSIASHAIPFSIVPMAGTTLPSSIISGQFTPAFYTVTNNTASVRLNNYVKYLPPNVTQVTTDPAYSNLCGSTFTLNPRGTPGDSCTLELSVNGPVNGADPDPHHHLFVCFPGGMACAGTNNGLNVSAGTSITQTRAYVGNSATDTIFLCSITAGSGLLNCVDSGATSLQSFPGFFSFNPAGTRVYIPLFAANGGFPSTGTEVFQCDVDTNTGTLSGCRLSTDGFTAPISLTFNAVGTRAYVSNFVGFISLCHITPGSGELTACTPILGTPFGFGLIGVTLNASETIAYVVDQGSTIIWSCSVNQGSGMISNCVNSVTDGSGTFLGPAVLALNSSGTRAYISDNGGGTGTLIYMCSVNIQTGFLSGCVSTGGPFLGPGAVVLNGDNSLLYVTNQANGSVSICSVNPLTGLLSSCQEEVGFNNPLGLAFQ